MKYEKLTPGPQINYTTIPQINQPCLMSMKKQNYRHIVRCFKEYVS